MAQAYQITVYNDQWELFSNHLNTEIDYTCCLLKADCTCNNNAVHDHGLLFTNVDPEDSAVNWTSGVEYIKELLMVLYFVRYQRPAHLPDIQHFYTYYLEATLGCPKGQKPTMSVFELCRIQQFLSDEKVIPTRKYLDCYRITTTLQIFDYVKFYRC